jgi:hypothetical protein
MVNHRLPSFDVPVETVDGYDESPLLDEDYAMDAKKATKRHNHPPSSKKGRESRQAVELAPLDQITKPLLEI